MPFRLQLSTDGENLAQDEPYVIRNGGNWELVIHTSEQVREFYRKDGKGKLTVYADLHDLHERLYDVRVVLLRRDNLSLEGKTIDRVVRARSLSHPSHHITSHHE